MTSSISTGPLAPLAAATALEELVKKTLARTGVPGAAICVVHEDRVIYCEGFGVREVGKAERVDGDTVFQLASLSKPIASTVMAGLIDRGKVDWDDPIVEHDRGFALRDPQVTKEVTMRDMFAHRSGLPSHAADLLEDIGHEQSEILRRLRYEALSTFRQVYAYTNFGLTAAGVAAAKAYGQSWEDSSTEVLYRPLKMASTSSRFADFEAAKNRARGHVRENGKWIARYQRRPDSQSPAGGVSSTARDLGQWMRLQLGGGRVDGVQVISSASLAETHAPQIQRNPPNPGDYGLGWNVDHDDQGQVRLSHSGAFALGAGTAVDLRPADKLGIVILTNGEPIGVPEALIKCFFDLMSTGKVQRDWVELMGFRMEAAMHPDGVEKSASAYVGTYGNEYYGDIVIEEEPSAKSGLRMLQGPGRAAFPLEHWDGHAFFYGAASENASGLKKLTFHVEPSGVAMGLEVESLAERGWDLFFRKPHRSGRPGWVGEHGGEAPSISVRFVNLLSEAVSPFWVNFKGEEEPWGRIEPGAELAVKTYALHLWVFRDASGAEVWRWYARSAEAGGRIEIR
jgi:CubicO group peptidase (beta-lactamase class C family)